MTTVKDLRAAIKTAPDHCRVELDEGYLWICSQEGERLGRLHIGARGPDTLAEKTLNVTNPDALKLAVPDVELYGDSDMWKCVCKASSQKQGWMKSTKLFDTRSLGGGGFLVQVTTQQKNPDGTWALAEALAYIPLE